MRRWESGTVSNHSRALVPVFAPGTSCPNCDDRNKQGSLGRALAVAGPAGAAQRTICGTCRRAPRANALGRPARGLRNAALLLGRADKLFLCRVSYRSLAKTRGTLPGISASERSGAAQRTVTGAPDRSTAATTKRATVPALMLTSPMGLSTQHAYCAGSKVG